MERLFSPCTRFHDILASQGRLEVVRYRHRPEPLRELNLDVSTEELLSAERAFTYADLFAMLGNLETVAWLTPHAAVVCEGGQLVEACHFCFSADGKAIVAMARSPEHLLEICDVVLRLLAASVCVVHSVILQKVISVDVILINAPTLAYLMEHCQSLKALTLKGVEALDENHCRVLGANSRPDLKVVLSSCELTSNSSAWAEVLERNQGPTALASCCIDNFVLANGLRGNSRLKSLRPRLSNDLRVNNREVLAIASALRENKGLVNLDLQHDFTMIGETWDAVCDSLKTHPTLQVLNLRSTPWPSEVPRFPAELKPRVQALVDMLKVNMLIHTIHLTPHHSEHELFRGSVIPYLETNRLRPRLLAIQKTRPIAYRTKVLGRALFAVRTDPNRFWMLLSGNAEVLFPSTTATVAAAANLPTTGTAAATSAENVAAVAASMMSALTTTATGSLPTASAAAATSAATPSSTASDAFASDPTTAAAAAKVAKVATPSAGQKRKARPIFLRTLDQTN
jgi:hypothetical protein